MWAALFFLLAADDPAVTPTDTSTPAAAPTTAWQQPTWDFIVVPVIGVNVDEGAAGGVLFAVHRYDKDGGPFLDDFALRFFLSSKLVQRHELKWEGTKVGGLPLRIATRVGFYSTVTQNYCGTGNRVTCDVDEAEAAADDRGLVDDKGDDDDEHDQFVRRYFATRFVRPHGDVLVRWAFTDLPYKVEAMAGARLAYYIPGAFDLDDDDGFASGPYEGSLYDQRFEQGEPGLSSVLQAGVTIDHRDFEPDPTRGFFAEASLRGSSPQWFSNWRYAGANASVAFYVPLPLSTTLATRTIADVLIGDVPTEDLATTGGTRDHTAFGGQWIGRGLREHRGLGKVKLIEQLELRRPLYEFSWWKLRADIGAGVFFDAAFIGDDVSDLAGGFPDRGSLYRPLFGGGVGLRILINRSLLMRIDVAASPQEQQFPSFYTPFNYPF